jgi:hypothetical protein
MAVSATPYGKFLLELGKGSFNLSTDTIKAALTTSSYSPNIDTHEFFSDVTNEASGTGYTAGGMTLTNVTWAYNSSQDYAILTADPVLWTGITITARRAVVYKSTGTASTSRLIGYVDFGVDRSQSGSNEFVLNFTLGVVRLRVG